jgi:hypothetical protein
MVRFRAIVMVGPAALWLMIAGRPAVAQELPAKLRWVQGCGEAGEVQLRIGAKSVGRALNFGGSSDYVVVPVETQAASLGDARGTVLRASLRLTSGGFYTLVLGGRRAAPRLIVLEDRLPQPGPLAAVRWVHAGGAEDPELELRDGMGTLLLPALAPGMAADYRSVPVGSPALRLNEPGQSEPRLAAAAQSLRAGGAYTLVVVREEDRYRLVRLRDR